MSDLRHYNTALQTIVATGVGRGLSVRQLMDGLLNQLAGVVVAGSASDVEVEQTVETARHDLDLKVVEYQRRAGNGNGPELEDA